MSRFALLAVFALSAFAASSAQSNPTVLINYPGGFTGVTGLQVNGSATFNDAAIQLTSGGQFQAGSVFSTTRLQSIEYTTDFDFQITDAQADGFAFVIQSAGPDALGSYGGGVGYGNPPAGTGPYIPASIAIVFDLHNNQGEGNNSVRVERNGVTSTTIPSYDAQTVFDLTPSGLDLHSGHIFHVEIASYMPNGAPGVFITDLATGKTATCYTALLSPQTGGTAYIGFTGATGATTATQKILNWTYTSYNPVTYGGGLTVPAADISFPNGFAGATGLKFNGDAGLNGSAIQLTKGTQFEANSVFTTKLIEAGNGGFVTDFDFNLGDGSGDGFAFVIQGESPSAVGDPGGGLGYGSDHPGVDDGHKITYSQAIKFDLHNNAGEGVNSTGFYLNGASPTTPSIDLTPSGLNLHTGHNYHANLNFTYFSPYGAPTPFTSSVVITITDLTTYKVFYKTIPIDSRNLAIGEFDYVGFTAGTGATPSSIQILNWRVLAGKG